MSKSLTKTLTTEKLVSKTNKILKSNDAVHHLNDIVQYFELCMNQQQSVVQCLLKLEEIFTTLFENSRMTISTKPSANKELTIDEKNIEILHHLFTTTKSLALKCLLSKSIENCCQSLTILMKFLALQQNIQSYQNILNEILTKLLSRKQSNKHLFQHWKQRQYSQYVDVIYYTWKILLKHTTKGSDKPNDFYIENYLNLLSAIPINVKALNSTENAQLLCNNLVASTENTINYKDIKKNLNKLWQQIIDWQLNPTNHKQILLILIDCILEHLTNPIIMTDFLMDSLNIGGQISVLALQGVFMLCQQCNIAYPNIYEKLYSLFQPEIFHAKYKARLFYLADLFLSSTHLTKQLIAAFAKRLARLSLIAPPQDITIILYFIENLLIRHPEVKDCMMKIALSQRNQQLSVNDDPFVMNEQDPLLSNALGSTLWEIHCHKRHVMPIVEQLSTDLIIYRLPNVEWDLSQYLDVTDNDIFDQEMGNKSKCGLNFERINDVSKNKQWMYWNL